MMRKLTDSQKQARHKFKAVLAKAKEYIDLAEQNARGGREMSARVCFNSAILSLRQGKQLVSEGGWRG